MIVYNVRGRHDLGLVNLLLKFGIIDMIVDNREINFSFGLGPDGFGGDDF